MKIAQCVKFIATMSVTVSFLSAAADETSPSQGQPQVVPTKSTRVSITADDKVWSSSEEMTVYRSKCLDNTYELRIDPLAKKVSFSSSGDGSRVSDITSSRFAQTILNKKFYIRIAITCYKEYASIYVAGYDNSSGKPLPITESLLINNDSTVTGDSGLNYEKEGYIESKKTR